MAYEDFTTYTEVDEGSNITVESAIKISWNDLSRGDTSYVYKDMGVNHFSGDFEHKFECIFTESVLSNWGAWWGVFDNIGHLGTVSNGYALSVYRDQTMQLNLFENGSEVAFDSYTPTISTLYFITIVRDDDGGINGTGRVTAYIRTGSHTGNLEDTLIVDNSVGEQNDLRYVYAVISYDSARPNYYWDGYTQNLDLGISYAKIRRAFTVLDRIKDYSAIGRLKDYDVIGRIKDFTLN